MLLDDFGEFEKTSNNGFRPRDLGSELAVALVVEFVDPCLEAAGPDGRDRLGEAVRTFGEARALLTRGLVPGDWSFSARLRIEPDGDAEPCEYPEPSRRGGTKEERGASSSSSSVVAWSSSSASLSTGTTDRGFALANELVEPMIFVDSDRDTPGLEVVDGAGLLVFPARCRGDDRVIGEP